MQPSPPRFGKSPGPPKPGTLVGGRFFIEGHAGSGGMATVFRATDRRTGCMVALKVLRSDREILIERFAQEAAILAELDHPGIVRYVAHDVSHGGVRYVAMEWFEGEDLFKLLSRRRLSIAESLTAAHRAARALGFAHARGMVHRDVKPSNILVPSGDVGGLKLIDFGVARLVEDTRRLTDTGMIMGTPAYMAPEQVQGRPMNDSRSDVFSLGCVLFECLAGRPLFEGTNAMAVFAKILLQDVPSLRSVCPDIPAPVDELVARMLAKSPSDRPRDGDAVAAEIAALPLMGDAWTVPVRGHEHGAPPDAIDQTLLSATLSPPLPPSAEPIRPSAPEPIQPLAPEPLQPLAPEPPRPAPPAPVSPPFQVLWDQPPPSRESQPPSLTLTEQRLVSLVLAGHPDSVDSVNSMVDPIAAELRAEIERHGGSVEALAGGPLIVTVWGEGTALDRAESAARCALVLRARVPHQPVVVTTGRGRVLDRVVEPDLVEAAVSTLRASRPGAVQLDACTAAMVRLRFHVDEEEGGELVLRGELAADEGVPLLLGRRTSCVGRSRELSILEGILAGCVEDSVASPVLVTGAAGSGKSRLCQELLARLRRELRSVEILVGRGSSAGTGAPFAILAEAIRGAAGIRDGEALTSRQEKLAARVARHVPDGQYARVLMFLGEMLGISTQSAFQAREVAGQNAMLMGDSLRAAWEDWLAAELGAGPVLLVLENLQWSDGATVSLVDSTLRNLHDRPLMVLALARDEVSTKYPSLWAERNMHRLHLSKLPRKASEKLVEEILGEGAPPGVVGRIVERAEGNPFHLEELIRAVATGRGNTFPDSVLAAVEARLAAEGTQARRVLRAASIFGDRFSSAGVEVLVGAERRSTDVARQLAALAERELVARVGPSGVRGGTDYVFQHAIIREAAFTMLTGADRSAGHRLAGDWLERTGHSDAMAVAEHFRLGGEPERAVAGYCRAAEQALEANDLGAALLRVARGVECGAAGEALGSLRLIEAEARLWCGELAAAKESADQAVSLFPVGSAGWFVGVTRAVAAAGKLGGIDRVERWIRQACAVPPAPDARIARIDCLCAIVTFLLFDGRRARAEVISTLLERTAAAVPDLEPQQAALIEQTRAIRAVTSGDLAAGLDGFRAAIAAFERTGDQRNATVVRTNMGFTLAALGDFDGAEQALRVALSTSSTMGLLDSAAAAHQNLGIVLALRAASGSSPRAPLPEVSTPEELLAKAKHHEQQAMEIFRRLGDPRMGSLSRSYLARIHLFSGNLDTALTESRAAAEAASGTPGPRAVALAVFAQVQLARGLAGEAHEAAREAHAVLEALGALDDGEALVRLAYAQALLSLGEEHRAAAVVAEARDRLLERAAKIGDPSWRQRFLTEVPDNALTLELAAAHGVPSPERRSVSA